MKEIKRLKPYLLNLIIIWLVIIFYKTLPYYKNFLRPQTQFILFSLAITYTIIAFFYYLFYKKTNEKSKGELIFNLIKKIFTFKLSKITKQEKTGLLFIIVKIFFLPIMLNFILNNYYFIKSKLSSGLLIGSLSSITTFNTIFFPFALGFLFFIDTLWFGFGYATEAGFLKNKIKSVEPTILGWVVAIACYPPFNSFVVKYIDWFANDHVVFSTPIITFVFRIFILFLIGIYVSATLALGTKSSNLTNRGIVTRGPYSIIRHPAYISKNLVWWLTIIPVLSWQAILSMSAWSFIYHLRTITEERHLSKDPDYIKYKNKVRYRYIPGVY